MPAHSSSLAIVNCTKIFIDKVLKVLYLFQLVQPYIFPLLLYSCREPASRKPASRKPVGHKSAGHKPVGYKIRCYRSSPHDHCTPYT